MKQINKKFAQNLYKLAFHDSILCILCIILIFDLISCIFELLNCDILCIKDNKYFKIKKNYWTVLFIKI